MNGKLQGIIVCGVVVVCLVGVMLFLKFGTKDTGTTDSSSSAASSSEVDESVVILTKSSDDISSIKVTNTHGTYTLEKSSSGKTSWSIDKIASVNQNTTEETTMRENLSKLSAEKLVESNVEDMSKYGLDKPTAHFTVKYTDGTSKTMYIGSVAPKNDQYTYVRLDSEDKVYLVQTTTLSYYTNPATSYVSTALIEKPASDDAWPDYGKEIVERKDLDYKMVFQNDSDSTSTTGVSAQVMTEPIFSYLNVTNSSTVTHGMWGLTATSCEKVNPTKADFKTYGLDDPYCTVTLTGEKYDYKLKIGKAIYEKTSDASSSDNGSDTSSTSSTATFSTTDTVSGYYCYLTGVKGCDAIYVISASSLPWTTTKADDVITSLMTTDYVVDVTNMTIDNNGEKTSYDITSNGTSASSTTDSGDSVTVQSVTSNGKKLDVENFKSFYEYVISCPTSEIYFKDPTGSAYLTITLKCKDGHTDKIQLYKDTERRSIVKLNGKTSFRIQSAWSTTLINNINLLAEGKTISDIF